MARARNIKPALFKNELLGTEDPILTLLFIGLWCLADREGRLEDRPLRIRAEVFPYRDIELSLFNASLTQLASLGFIWRYEVDGIKVIQICKFQKHQSPHSTEKASELPAYVAENTADTDLTEVVALNNESLTQAKRSDSLLLIPDSLNTECGERAHAPRELPALANGLDALDMFKVAFPTQRLTAEQKKAIADKVRDGTRWQSVFDYWKLNGYKTSSVGKMLEKYDELGQEKPNGKSNGNHQYLTASEKRGRNAINNERITHAYRTGETVELLSTGPGSPTTFTPPEGPAF